MAAEDQLGQQFGYRGLHQPGDGPPIHNLLEGGEAPADVYTHMHYYTTGDDAADAESMAVLRRVRGDRPVTRRPAREAVYFSGAAGGGLLLPEASEETNEHLAWRQARRQAGEHLVTVYRAAPRGLKRLHTGDWVTPSPMYARQHAMHATDKSRDMPVYSAKVPAKHVRWPADSINEFGYSGPGASTRVFKRGGRNAEKI